MGPWWSTGHHYPHTWTPKIASTQSWNPYFLVQYQFVKVRHASWSAMISHRHVYVGLSGVKLRSPWTDECCVSAGHGRLMNQPAGRVHYCLDHWGCLRKERTACLDASCALMHDICVPIVADCASLVAICLPWISVTDLEVAGLLSQYWKCNNRIKYSWAIPLTKRSRQISGNYRIWLLITCQ